MPIHNAMARKKWRESGRIYYAADNNNNERVSGWLGTRGTGNVIVVV